MSDSEHHTQAPWVMGSWVIMALIPSKPGGPSENEQATSTELSKTAHLVGNGVVPATQANCWCGHLLLSVPGCETARETANGTQVDSFNKGNLNRVP